VIRAAFAVVVAHVVSVLDGLAALEPRLALREAGAVVAQLARSFDFGDLIQINPHASEPVWRTLAVAEGLTLQAFVWPVGSRTTIHDHTSWGVYMCLLGQLGEERYVRLDDEGQAGRAQLRQVWRRIWSPQEQSQLLPYAAGIHRVRNAGLSHAMSLHLYGPRLSAIDGRDYDPHRDRVCDRPPEAPLSLAA
jgi:predicted metal-dependent enzyme (double-stranded beta helix superfamily)